MMTDNEFWDRVRRGCEKLEIPTSTLHVWKHRGRVSRDQLIPIYQALQGTEHEISLDQLKGTS